MHKTTMRKNIAIIIIRLIAFFRAALYPTTDILIIRSFTARTVSWRVMAALSFVLRVLPSSAASLFAFFAFGRVQYLRSSHPLFPSHLCNTMHPQSLSSRGGISMGWVHKRQRARKCSKDEKSISLHVSSNFSKVIRAFWLESYEIILVAISSRKELLCKELRPKAIAVITLDALGH